MRALPGSECTIRAVQVQNTVHVDISTRTTVSPSKNDYRTKYVYLNKTIMVIKYNVGLKENHYFKVILYK